MKVRQTHDVRISFTRKIAKINIRYEIITCYECKAYT